MFLKRNVALENIYFINMAKEDISLRITVLNCQFFAYLKIEHQYVFFCQVLIK